MTRGWNGTGPPRGSPTDEEAGQPALDLLDGLSNGMECLVTHLSVGLLMAPAEGGSPMMALIVQIGLIILIFYWLLVRPQRKEKDRHQAMIDALKKGDEVVTVGGIVGTIVHADKDRLTVQTAENTRLVVERGKVGRALGDEAGKSSDAG